MEYFYDPMEESVMQIDANVVGNYVCMGMCRGS